MKNIKTKGKYALVEDLFPENLRDKLPVNAFLLRIDLTKEGAIDGRIFSNSKTHKSNRFIVSYFYKPISNTF